MINPRHIINGHGKLRKKRHKRYEREGAHRRDYRDDKNSGAQPMGNEQRAYEHRHRRMRSEIKDIRLKADKTRLSEAFDNITITLRVFETLNEITDSKVIWKSVQDIVEEMLDEDDDESLTDVSDDESCPMCDSDSD